MAVRASGHPGLPGQPPPLLRAYDLETGKEVWTRDFSAYGSGGDDAGICLMDGRLYYSCFFGHSAQLRSGQPGPQGITAAIEPETGKIDLAYDEVLGPRRRDDLGQGRPALPGRIQSAARQPACHVWCLDAKDGSLVWQSEPLVEAIHVVTIGPQSLFVHAQYKDSYLLDKETGKILATLAHGYKCTRFTLFRLLPAGARDGRVRPVRRRPAPSCSAPGRGWTPASASGPASPTGGSSTPARAGFRLRRSMATRPNPQPRSRSGRR